jgi:pyruvate/2-oxoglutarate dehydrogenase complex dihydrolipoamide dehydrogenase (E3) component/rhodanese-related sulfurtransferase
MHVPAEAERLRDLIEDDQIDKAVFVGGGRIALEVTEAFFAQAVNSVIIEREDSLLPAALDPEMAASVAHTLRNQGVEIFTSEKVLRIEGSEGSPECRVITETLEIAADAVIVATGVEPNVRLAADAGLTIGKTGAIAVNGRLQTSDPDIYAGGDCVECINLVSGEKVYAPLGSTANRHGRVIGDNVVGGDSTFPGVVGTAAMRTMGLNIAVTGVTERRAKALGYDTLACVAPWMDRAHFYPGGKPIMIKMVADAADGRLLGAQAVGAGDVTKRIDVLATALTHGATIDDVANLDIGYAPPYSTALDNIAHAANLLRNKRDGLADSITPMELRERSESAKDFVMLDVREQSEVEKSGFEADNVCAIPLSRLSGAAGELPEDKELICFCKLGMRSYEACRMLKRMDIHNTKFLEGGLRLWNETDASNA